MATTDEVKSMFSTFLASPQVEGNVDTLYATFSALTLEQLKVLDGMIGFEIGVLGSRLTKLGLTGADYNSRMDSELSRLNALRFWIRDRLTSVEEQSHVSSNAPSIGVIARNSPIGNTGYYPDPNSKDYFGLPKRFWGS